VKNFSRVSHKWVHYKRICFTASRSPQEPQDGQSSPESKYECVMRERPMQSLFRSTESCLDTGVNPAGDAGDTSPNILVGGRQQEYPPQYYYILSDIADQYWLPSVRSASSRFYSAIRRHQFASVRQADSRLTRLVPCNLELALTPLCLEERLLCVLAVTNSGINSMELLPPQQSNISCHSSKQNLLTQDQFIDFCRAHWCAQHRDSRVGR